MILSSFRALRLLRLAPLLSGYQKILKANAPIPSACGVAHFPVE